MTYSSTQYQFTHLLQDVADRLGMCKSLKATGGTTATIIDTAISSNVADDDYNEWWAFVKYDAAGAGAAPEGEYQQVSNYTASSKTLATGTFSAAIAAGDLITLVRNSPVTLYDLMSKCNEAIRKYRIPVTDESITITTDTAEYSLPLAVKGPELLNVELLTSGDADDGVTPIGWIPVPATSGTQDKIRIDQYDTTDKLRLTYRGRHALLVNYYDPVNEYIPPEFAAAWCALYVARTHNASFAKILPNLEQEFALVQRDHPIRQFVKRVQGFPHW